MSARDDTWWPADTLEERMQHGADVVEVGDPDEMRLKQRAWELEHEAVLRALGITPEGEEEADSDADDLDDYDDLFEDL